MSLVVLSGLKQPLPARDSIDVVLVLEKADRVDCRHSRQTSAGTPASRELAGSAAGQPFPSGATPCALECVRHLAV